MKLVKIIGLSFLLLLAGLTAYYFYPEPGLPAGKTVDKLVVYKSRRQLLAYSGGQLLKTYEVSLGRQPIGHKAWEGDGKTPEGLYFINAKNPNSGYHKNLGISYPNEADRKRAKSMGKPTGGDVKIHGFKNGMLLPAGPFHRLTDWTLGCIAVTNKEVDELYEAVAIGTPIEINP
jgi:murein L,D-transpeptidase YafK